jgi:hypothetical protein
MYRKLLPVILFFFFANAAYSQKGSISGTLKDTTTHLNMKNAVVALLTLKDTIIVGFDRAKDDGSYNLKNIEPGKYILMVTHPQFADFVDDVNITAGEQKIPAISVTPKSKLMETVIINSRYAMRVKGDTTSYLADSFKVSANANVEELLKKLPGIQVDKDGKIKAMGQTVEKVLVDGEEFFGDDPGMAVKNLRADAVKEVQVFDKKSDQAEFTGIDDGKTQKTINLKLKDNKKNGYFGKIDLAGGLQKDIDNRYNSNLLYSTFKGKRKLSAFVLSGNTGQDGIDWQDYQKYGLDAGNITVDIADDGGSSISISRGGGSDDEPYINTDNGFIKSLSSGLQYSNKWNDKQTLNLSPKYQSQIYDNTSRTFSQQALGGDSSLNTNSTDKNHVNRYNFKLSGSYDIKIDSMNSLKLVVKGNFYHTESEDIQSAMTARETGTAVNNSNSNLRTKSDKQSFYASLLYRHKFKKARRTFSLNADWTDLSALGTNFLTSHNESFDPINPFVIDKNQMINNDKNSGKLSATAVYTEPLGKKYAILFSHEVAYYTGQNNQTTYNYNPASSKYETLVDSLTNNFNQKIIVNKPTVTLNYSYKKIKMNIGSGFSFTHFDLLDKTFNKDYIRDYVNFSPNANFKYAYKSNHSLNISYSGNTQQPTINELQPLRNSTDEFNQYIGNPDLKPSFTNSFNLELNSYNFIKNLWTYVGSNFSFTNNSIISSRVINAGTGKIISKPVNTNGNTSSYFYSGFGFKIKKIDLQVQGGPGFYYSRFADITNNILSYSKTVTPTFDLGTSKSKDKKYDVSLRYNISYNYTQNSQSTLKNNYIGNRFNADVTKYFYKVWSINTTYEINSRQKTSLVTGNLSNSLWNAGLQRTFKKDEFTAYFKVRDILNQNIGIDRNIDGKNFTEVVNDRLKRYFLLGFTWNFKNKAPKSN